MKHLGNFIKVSAIACTLVGGFSMITSCGNKQDPKGAAAAGAQQTPTYKVMTVQPMSTTLYSSYPASLEGSQNIDIRPKVDGYIEAIYVDEGQKVSRGTPLFKISNPQYEEQVRNAQAAIKSAEADILTARLQVEKTTPLVKEGIISAYELKTAQNTLAAKEAILAQAKTNLANAKINVGYTNITSPVNGVVGLIPNRIGSYVSSATAQPLTTVSDINKIYAYFSMNEKEQLSMMKEAGNNSFMQQIKALPAVTMTLADGSEYSEKGKVETVSGQINTATGSFNVRATFPNPQGLLRTGNSATIKIPTHVNNAIVIPQKATYEMQDKRVAYIIDKENKVTAVAIKVREVPGGQLFVVDEGLNANDKILVEGVGIVAEGTAIQPQIIPLDSVITIK